MISSVIPACSNPKGKIRSCMFSGCVHSISPSFCVDYKINRFCKIASGRSISGWEMAEIPPYCSDYSWQQ
ncbi:hypothetical protein GDO78_020961 [Eleutherodactylus coqui]|uniref:Uncharacterized protein n=1 Tax=Eleutherodactylus coqui TaxID=57060 RepID=A0A8J6B632_ELECQ|nr:hypothetical protein GDO78_020961 [Eleutherodactylus coqui]